MTDFLTLESLNIILAGIKDALSQKASFTQIEAKMDKENPVGTGSFSMNRANNTSIGANSATFGVGNTASGESSFATGGYTKALGYLGHAEGMLTKAIGQYSHAEGATTVAEGDGSHAEGEWSEAIGDGSHAEGIYSVAEGESSHAEGNGSHAKGLGSHAEGLSIAASDYQHSQGKYNIESTEFAHIVGNGTEPQARSNAHTLDWNGNAWFAGEVYVGSTDGINKDSGSKKLATEDFVNNLLQNSQSSNITYSTEDLIAGESPLAEGEVYLVYE